MSEKFRILGFLILFLMTLVGLSAQEAQTKPNDENKPDADNNQADDTNSEPKKTYDFKQPIYKGMIFERTTTTKINSIYEYRDKELDGDSDIRNETETQTLKFKFLEVKEDIVEKVKIEIKDYSVKTTDDIVKKDEKTTSIQKIIGEWFIAIRNKDGKYILKECSEKLAKLLEEEEIKAKKKKKELEEFEDEWKDWDENDLLQNNDKMSENSDESDGEMDLELLLYCPIKTYIRFHILWIPFINGISVENEVSVGEKWVLNSVTFKIEKIEKINDEEIAYISYEKNGKSENDETEENFSLNGMIQFNITKKWLIKFNDIYKSSCKYKMEDSYSSSDKYDSETVEEYKYLETEKDEKPDEPKGEE